MFQNESFPNEDPSCFVDVRASPRMHVQGNFYHVRHVGWEEHYLQQEYWRLRAEVFVKQLKWKLPIDMRGCERDRYDDAQSNTVSVFCIYGERNEQLRGNAVNRRHLLGGCRIFSLQSWDESMAMNEFRQAGMIPEHIIERLQTRYTATDFIEVTRLCLRRKQHMPVHERAVFAQFSAEVARDLAYAAVYMQADRSQRHNVLGVATAPYLKVLNHTRFVYDIVYSHHLHTPAGYALIIIDLDATAHSMLAAGFVSSVAHMLSGTNMTNWVDTETQTRLFAVLSVE